MQSPPPGSSGASAPRSRGDAPGPDPERSERRLRSDRVFGIVLFVFGGYATLTLMVGSTEDALASQVAMIYDLYGVGTYSTRPEGLDALGTVAIVAYLVNFALWLYLAIVRWQRRRRAAWCAFAGAAIAILIGIVVGGIALSMHPEFLDWVAEVSQSGELPEPTGT